jgi:uncharacterized repeat protein (TIGR01451 family)
MFYSPFKAFRRLLAVLFMKCGFLLMFLLLTACSLYAQSPHMFLPKIDVSKVDVGISLSLDTENKLELVLSVFNYGKSLDTDTNVSFSMPSELTLVNTIVGTGCPQARYDQAKSLVSIPTLGSAQECVVRFVVTNAQNAKTISARATLLESRDVNAVNDKVWPTFDLGDGKGDNARSFITSGSSPAITPQGAALSNEGAKSVNAVTCDHTEDSYSPTTFTCSDGSTLTGHCVIEQNPRCAFTTGFYFVTDTWTSAQRGRVQYLIDNNCVNSHDLWGVLGQLACSSACCTNAVSAFPTGSTSTAGPFQLLHTDNGRVYPVNDGAPCQDFLVYPQPTPPCSINSFTVTPNCNNNGTSSVTTDDYRTFSITASGTGTAATYNASVNNSGTLSPTSGSYNSATSFRLQNGSAGNSTIYTITLTDATNASCTKTATISDPGICSTSCSFTAAATTPVCNNNGTPNITTDDTYTFNVTATSVSGTSATGYNANDPLSTMGTYGTAKSFGPYAISSNGTLNVTLTDKATGSCTFALPAITAPSPCSTPVVVGQPDLELTKVADKATVVSGNTLTYTITLKNTGTVAATGVKVKDSIPAGLTYGSATASQGTYTSGTGIWDVGTVAQGATLTLTITVTVN